MKKSILSALALSVVVSGAVAYAAPANAGKMGNSIVMNRMQAPTVWSIISKYGQLNKFSEILSAYGSPALMEMLGGMNGEYTVFAPSNSAVNELMRMMNDMPNIPMEHHMHVLGYHVIPGKVFSHDLPDGVEVMVKTLNGQYITVHRMGNDVHVNGIAVKQANMEADNGVVHVLDGVLMPKMLGM